MKKLESYVGTLLTHTAKAVRLHGKAAVGTCHADRVFAVVGVEEGYLVAWKCDLLPDGRLGHPAFRRPLHVGDERLYVRRGRGGETPTAVLRPDSYYRAYP